MINIQNESSLHNTLKILYATKTNGKSEVKEDRYIYDIVTKNQEIIEIQTKNLSSLYPKIKYVLSKNRKITVVYPLPITTTIYTTDENGNFISKRKSSKKGNIYDFFKEITGLYKILLEKNFKLIILEINIIEHRIKTKQTVQSQNKKRRFKKDWIKINKRLSEIITERVFTTKNDYLSMLPSNLNKEFCAKDIKNELEKDPSIPKRIYDNANLIIWVLNKMNLISQTKTINKSHYYKINK